jgi:hypothetical protein
VPFNDEESEGQDALILASDPLTDGSNLFGTAERKINYYDPVGRHWISSRVKIAWSSASPAAMAPAKSHGVSWTATAVANQASENFHADTGQ